MMEMMILDDNGAVTGWRVATRSAGLARLAETREEVARLAAAHGVAVTPEVYEIGLVTHSRECGGRHCPDELGMGPGCSFEGLNLTETT
ncbi:hypothetical protein [Pseudonocardia kongjuensis]